MLMTTKLILRGEGVHFSRRSFIIGTLSIPLTIPALMAFPPSTSIAKNDELAGPVLGKSWDSFERTSSNLIIRSWEPSNTSYSDEKYVTFPASWKTGW